MNIHLRAVIPNQWLMSNMLLPNPLDVAPSGLKVVKGKLGRLLGIFENQDRKHRTYVYVLTVTEVLEDWEDSVNIGRKREWFIPYWDDTITISYIWANKNPLDFNVLICALSKRNFQTCLIRIWTISSRPDVRQACRLCPYMG
uniref:Uncharacterized protein n=1 Tax=Xenopus tropicalis TaxID=8364 RepID=A0A6I8QF55_XENTR